MIRAMTLVASVAATLVCATTAAAKEAKKPTQTAAQQIAALMDRVAYLEERVSDLRQRSALLEGSAHSVVAPFAVTDDKGRAIMEVTQGKNAAIKFYSYEGD